MTMLLALVPPVCVEVAMAAPLEYFVNTVRSLTLQGNFEGVCDLIKQSNDLLSKNAQNLDTLLGALDMQEHSLGVLAVLNAKLQLPLESAVDFEMILSQVHEFVNVCNGEQIRHSPSYFAQICHHFTQALLNMKQPIRGICILCKAITKIQMSDTQLTSIHADLAQLCLVSRCFKPALPFLDTDVTDISREQGQFDCKHLLSYYYYGGLIYTALKNFERALYFFEVAITTPAVAVSHIMLESYKKFVLVSLIYHGKVQPVPKYTSNIVTRFIKPLCQPYHDLSSAFATNNQYELQGMYDKYTDIYTRDKNFGLVKQVMNSLYKKNIQRLTKTFLTLSLTDMANRVQLSGPREAERYVLNMIEDGEIYATINQKDGMVHFHDNPEKYHNPTMLKSIETKMWQCIRLDERLRLMDNELACDAQYIKKSSGVSDEGIELALSASAIGTSVSTSSISSL